MLNRKLTSFRNETEDIIFKVEITTYPIKDTLINL